MSIIEKAVERMGRADAAAPSKTDVPAVPPAIEAAVAPLAEPVYADPVAAPVEVVVASAKPKALDVPPLHAEMKTLEVERAFAHEEVFPDAHVAPGETVSGIGADAGRRYSLTRVDLDLEYLKSRGMITPDMERSQIAEEYRHIKRPLLMNAFSGARGSAVPNGNLIMVTSARPGEGKTFTSINLALSIALERDKTVLLVDADVARPAVSKTLQIEPRQGLVDFLADGGKGLGEVMLRTNVPKLRLLPSGRRHPHSTELLSSENMRMLVEELATRYPDRVVIFDSPPLLATSEASVLASLVGQIVMVVEADKTKRVEVKDALALLDADKYVGLVLNKSRRPFGADYYSYGAYGAYAQQ